MEILDKRQLKREAEAAEPKEPTAVEIVQDRMDRASAALSNGDLAGANAVAAECKNPPATYGSLVEFKKTVKGEVQKWRSAGFVAAFLPMGQAQVLMVRAVGMRTDEKVFTADYAMPPVWGEGEDFNQEAMKRLDSFLACSCDERGRCKYHGDNLPGPGGPGGWLEADMKRLRKIQGSPLPEAVEVLMKAEAARAQQRIVVPGRP